MGPGKFISFEGGEGTGKSTQAALLATRLRAAGRQVLETREPGGTPEAEAIRALLVSGDAKRWSPDAEVLLNYAARDSHLNAVIRPALEEGRWVVCDRYLDSTRAYQGVAGGADTDLIAMLEDRIVRGDVPDITFVLDIDPIQGLERAGQREAANGLNEDRFETKGLAFHRTLRDAFLRIAEDDKDRCVLINAARPIDEIAELLWQAVVTRLAP